MNVRQALRVNAKLKKVERDYYDNELEKSDGDVKATWR